MRKKIIQLFLIYVLVQQSGAVVKRTWSDGQPIDILLAGETYQIVSEQIFNNEPDNFPDDTEKKNGIKQAILDAKDKSKEIDKRFDALIKALGL